MSKPYDFNWQPSVPTRLLKGELFDRWEDVSLNLFQDTETNFFLIYIIIQETGLLEENVLFRIDEYGFFLYWQTEGKDGQVLELTHVCDIRQGKQPNVKYMK